MLISGPTGLLNSGEKHSGENNIAPPGLNAEPKIIIYHSKY